MSLYDYRISQDIAMRDEPFYALVMAAMRRADSDNAELLRLAWPDVWGELLARYNAPGGLLPGEDGTGVTTGVTRRIGIADLRAAIAKAQGDT
jgi:hypothetical protein